ncbi:hypothetical protein HMPREF2907_05155 [Neisseria sp. HMSC055H02]|nr:hypothetical protein HMPREF2907_05155 [Neisseria sp. HMSC055H02]
MNIEYTKTTFETRQKLLKEEEDKCSELTAQIEAAEAGVTEAQAVINEFAGLRNRRKGIFANLLKMGKPTNSEEAKGLDSEIAAKREEADRAADMLEAQKELLESLFNERLQHLNRISELRNLLAVSRYEMFIIDIEETHLPEYMEAARAYIKAAAKLVGIGKASAEMRANLLENGLRADCPSYGQSMPDRIIDLRLPGFFNMMDGTGGEENAIFDILEDMEKEKEAALDNLK